MCIICYKPKNKLFPQEETLKTCFINNPDGAGFMYCYNDKVHIRKGYTTYEEFKQALDKAVKITGDKVPYVLHFRIATQGFEKTMTHPFPLSTKMNNLKKLSCQSDVAIAHNGIIHLTSDGSKQYSDTMKYITDYLSLIIDNLHWYKDKRKTLLIERMIDSSRLAILDKKSHCELIGTWYKDKDDECYYSNTGYKVRKSIYFTTKKAKNSNYQNGIYYHDDIYYNDSSYYYDSFDKYNNDYTFNKSNTKVSTNSKEHWKNFKDYNDPSKYNFTSYYCPYTEEDDDSLCSCCNGQKNCPYVKDIINEQTVLTK